MIGALAAIAAASGLAKAGVGLADLFKGNKLSKQYNLGTMPQESMADGYNQYFSQAEKNAQSGLPGEDMYKQDIRQTTAQGLTGVRQTASNESSAMAGLLGLMGQQRSSLRQLGERALQWEAQQQQNLAQAYQFKGQEQSRLFGQNQMLPWQIGMNQVESYRNSGRAGVGAGLDTLGASAIQGAGMIYNQSGYDDMINKILGQEQQGR